MRYCIDRFHQTRQSCKTFTPLGPVCLTRRCNSHPGRGQRPGSSSKSLLFAAFANTKSIHTWFVVAVYYFRRGVNNHRVHVPQCRFRLIHLPGALGLPGTLVQTKVGGLARSRQRRREPVPPGHQPYSPPLGWRTNARRKGQGVSLGLEWAFGEGYGDGQTWTSR